MSIGLRPLHDSFGAEVIGIDLAHALDDETFAAIEAAWYRYGILLFRGVRMTPQGQIAFTRRLGPLHVMEPREFNLPGHPEIFVVSNIEEGGKAVGLKRAGWGWHSDGEDKATPTRGRCSMLTKFRRRRAIRCLPTPTRRLRGCRLTCGARLPGGAPVSAARGCTTCTTHLSATRTRPDILPRTPCDNAASPVA
jgi:Taurine catabolism dioxygenase TauD, TfdA family